MANAAIPQGGDDNIMTPEPLAYDIVNHFEPYGHVCDPCAGENAFVKAFTRRKKERGLKDAKRITTITAFDIRPETAAGKKDCRDFLNMPHFRCDWIITNPPWSVFAEKGKARPEGFLERGITTAPNIVYLTHCNAWFTVMRVRKLREAGYAIREMLYVERPDEWGTMGLQLAAVHIAANSEPDRRTGKRWNRQTKLTFQK